MIESLDLLLLGAALLVLAVGLVRRRRLWRVGQEAQRTDRPGLRLKGMLLDAIVHLRILRDAKPGLMHLGLFLGFCAPLTVAVLAWAGLVMPAPLAFIVSLLLDLVALGALAGLLYAALRRYLFRPDRLDNKPEDAYVLLLFAGILATGFVVAGFRIARIDEGILPSPVTWIVARPLTLLSDPALEAAHPWVWRVHFLLVLTLAASIPYTRLLHVVTSPLNVFFRNLGPRGQASWIDLEDEEAETFGASDVQHYTWKDLFDLDACTRCGRCQDGCPAWLTEKPLSPKKVVQNMKDRWLVAAPEALRRKEAAAMGEDVEEEDDTSLIDEHWTRDVIWSCTTCRYCEEHCPVHIEPVSKILEARRYLVLMESDFPAELKDTFKNIENNGNPWGVGYSYRADWTEGLDVPLLEEGGEAVEVLYWVGCAGSFDERNKKISRAMVEIFRAAGVTFGILGTEETCCGDPARRTGNEYLYQMQMEQNLETLKARKFKRIVTPCPHCLHVLGTEYAQKGEAFEVVPHVRFLLELIEAGRLPLGGDGKPGRWAFHDSCYLGRYRGIYEEPRTLLARMNAGTAPLEAERNRERSFCCGAGGGGMWMEESLGNRINIARYKQFETCNPEMMATACPYCLTMFEDAVKDLGHEENVKVRDLAELVAERLPKTGAPPEKTGEEPEGGEAPGAGEKPEDGEAPEAGEADEAQTS